MIKGNYNEKLCEECEGKCCKRLPGGYSPQDIKRLFPAIDLKHSVEKALRTGKISIDWWEDDKPLYYLRPSTVEKVGVIYDPSWGGKCVFLYSDGCALPKNKRPETCRKLEPKPRNKKCITHYKEPTKYAIGLLWEKTKLDLSKF